MPDESALLRAVIENPDDDAPRLAYADWLDQQAAAPPDARAEFIRAQLEVSRVKSNGFDAAGMEARVRQRMSWMEATERSKALGEAFEAAWAGDLSPFVEAYTFDRGFIASATLSAQRFIDTGARILDSAPIVHVALTDARALLGPLFESPLLERIRALSLCENGLEDDDVGPLCRSTRLGNIWWLDLSFNRIAQAGVERLAAADNLRHVYFLSLNGNPVDPAETLGVDGQNIVDAALPPEGKALEARYGHIPWLHCHATTVLDHPPDPLGPPRRP